MTIDWQRVVLNLRSSGLSLARLAERVGMDAATLRRFARGELRDPRWSVALKLLDLHERLCPDRHRLDLIAEVGDGV